MKKAFKTATSRKKMKIYAIFAGQLIRRRTRLGYGVERNDSPKRKLRTLSPKYKFRRKKIPLSPFTRPGKSNLTRTGQLLGGISGKGKSQGKGEVYIKDKRNDGESNKEIAGYVSKDRPFMHLSKKEKKQLSNEIKKEIMISIEKNLKKL